MTYRRMCLSEDIRSPILISGDPAPTTAAKPAGPAEDIGKILQSMHAGVNTTISIHPLETDQLEIAQSLLIKRNPACSLSAAMVVRGVTFHDGQIGERTAEKVTCNNRLLEISRVQNITLHNAQNIILTEWCFYEKGDRDPRDRIGKKPVSSSIPIRERVGNRFCLSVNHTVYSKQTDLFETYIASLNRR